MLAVQDISKAYRNVQALQGLTCEFGVGVTGVLGPNGAGKTTLLRCLATTLVPDQGRIYLNGVALSELRAMNRYRSTLGYVPQEPGTLPKMRLRDFVEYVAATRRSDWSRQKRRGEVERALEAVGLSDRATTSLRKLSGGMKQRALLAQALVTHPGVLVLDEPTVGLDPQQRSLFRSLVSDLAKERIVILSTHLMEDVQSLRARTLVLDRGRPAFLGSLAELADLARGRVSLQDTIPDTGRYWHHSGTYRVVGTRATEAIEPLPEDGYLHLVGHDASTSSGAAGSWGGS